MLVKGRRLLKGYDVFSADQMSVGVTSTPRGELPAEYTFNALIQTLTDNSRDGFKAATLR